MDIIVQMVHMYSLIQEVCLIEVFNMYLIKIFFIAGILYLFFIYGTFIKASTFSDERFITLKMDAIKNCTTVYNPINVDKFLTTPF